MTECCAIRVNYRDGGEDWFKIAYVQISDPLKACQAAWQSLRGSTVTRVEFFAFLGKKGQRSLTLAPGEVRLSL